MAPRSTIPHSIQAAAERAVAEHAGVDAVVLFGSRARGDHRPDSDFDLAVIGKRPDDATRAILDAHPGIERVHTARPADLRRKGNTANAIEAAIVRQGIVVAGAWRRPRHRKEKLDVSTAELAQNLTSAARELSRAIQFTAIALNADSLHDLGATTDAFDAAERTGKAILWSYGQHPKKVHNLAALADQLENDITTDDDRAQRQRLAAILRDLNGLSPQGHVATYGGTGIFEITEDTADRAAKVAQLLGATLRRVATHHIPPRDHDDPEGLQALDYLHQSTLESVKGTAKALDEHTPEPLRHATLGWLNAAADASATLATRQARAASGNGPNAANAARDANARTLRELAGRWLDAERGAPPPPAAPPRREPPTPRHRDAKRVAAAIVSAPTAARRSLDTDPGSNLHMSAQAWRDLKAEATHLLEHDGPADHRHGRVRALASALTGTAEQHLTSADYHRAADTLDYRSRVIHATAMAASISDRAAQARTSKAINPTDARSCATMRKCTEATRALDLAPITTREDALVRITPNLTREGKGHVEHVIELLRRFDWRLVRIEDKLGFDRESPTQTRDL